MDKEDKFSDSMFTTDKSHVSDVEKEEEKLRQILDKYNMDALNDVVQENENRPINILKLNVFGAENKFRSSFMKKQLEPIISELDDNGNNLTLSKLLKKIDKTQLNFLKTDSVSNIATQLVQPEIQPFNIFNPDLLNVSVNLHLIPVKKFFLKVGTNVGNGEGDGYIKLQWRNIFGGGECIDVDTNIASNEFNMKSSRSQYLVNYSSPVFNNPNYKFSSMIYHSLRNIDFTSYHTQSIEGLTFKLGTNHLPHENKFNHELSVENLIRSIDIKINNSSSSNYRNNSLITDYYLLNAGENFKSSLTYSISKDNRNKKYIFDRGSLIRLSNEVSLFSNNKFIKSSFDYSKGFKINKDLTFNLNYKLGFLNPINNDLVHPMDKFHLGGPYDMKGWLIGGMGPKEMNMSIGGNCFHALGLNFFSSVPFFRDSNFKLHYFTNVGKLTNKPKEILQNNSISTGIGISFAHPMAAFELNYVVPVNNEPHDHLRKGLQWGIGISFL